MQAWQHIPQADILAEDLLIFYQNKKLLVGGICIIPFSKDLLIVRLINQDDDGRFFWSPLAYDESTKYIYRRYFEKQGIIPALITKELILASAIALKRLLSI